MSIENYICCVCVDKSKNLKFITEADPNNVQHILKLHTCAPLQKWLDTYQICEECLPKLDEAYSFVQQCLKSDELRQQLIEIPITVEIEDVIVKPKWTCELCGVTLALKSSLARHNARFHAITEEKPLEKNPPKPKKYTFNCNYCTETFTAASSVRLHIKRQHYREEELPENSLDVPSECSVIKFEVEEENDTVVKDELFDIGFEENISIATEEHKEKSKTPKPKIGPYKCAHCPEKFTLYKELMPHRDSKHRSERPYQCAQCDATFVRKTNLVLHIKHKHERQASKEYVCTTCGKRCSSQGALTYHKLEKHLNKREFRCEKCGKGFNTRPNLNTHLKVVHVSPLQKPHVCHLCDKRFSLKSGLDNHVKRHLGIKEFICHICSKRFIDNNDLKKHLVSHSEDRSFLKCNICPNKEFRSQDGLKKHNFLHHNIGNYKIPPRKFNCQLCPKAFVANSKLQKHIRSHTGEKPFVCEYCGKRFSDISLRRGHMKTVHHIRITKDNFGKEVQTSIVTNNSRLVADEKDIFPNDDDNKVVIQSHDTIRN